MKMILYHLAFIIYSLAAAATAWGQGGAAAPDPNITPTRAGGELIAVEPEAKRLVLKTDAGNVVTVQLGEDTVYMRVPPGEATLDKATRIALADIGVGDRVVARGRVSEDRRSVPARQVIVISKAELAQRRERDREDWRRRGVAGSVAEINPEAKEVVLLSRSGAGERRITLKLTDGVTLRRYPPDAVKFADALPSTLAELRVGDQLRARGERSPDGALFTPEEVVSGSFRMSAGHVVSVNAASGELTVTDLLTGQPLTVAVTGDSMLRRIPPDVVALVARRGAAQQGAGAEGEDLQEVIERLPALAVNDLKTGELVVVSSTVGQKPGRVTAITLALGLDPLINVRKSPGRANVTGSGTNLGLPGGVLDTGIGTP